MWTAAGALGWWPTVGGEGAWVWSAVAMMGSRPSADKSGAGKRNARARETYSSPQGQTAHRRGSGRRAGPSPRLLCAVGLSVDVLNITLVLVSGLPHCLSQACLCNEGLTSGPAMMGR